MAATPIQSPSRRTARLAVLVLVLACVHMAAASSACAFTVGGRSYDLCGLTRTNDNYEISYFNPQTGGRFNILFNIGAATSPTEGSCTMQGQTWPEGAALVQMDFGNGGIGQVACRSIGDQKSVHAIKYKIDPNVFPTQPSSADVAMAAAREETDGAPVDMVKLGADLYARPLTSQDANAGVGNPNDGVVLVYTASGKTTNVVFQCNPNEQGIGPLSGNEQVVDAGSTYYLQLKNAGGCGSHVASGLSGGWVFIIIFTVALFVYITGGIAFNVWRNGKSFTEAFPNPDFWGSLPGLFVDGCKFTWNGVMGIVDRVRGGSRVDS